MIAQVVAMVQSPQTRSDKKATIDRIVTHAEAIIANPTPAAGQPIIFELLLILVACILFSMCPQQFLLMPLFLISIFRCFLGADASETSSAAKHDEYGFDGTHSTEALSSTASTAPPSIPEEPEETSVLDQSTNNALDSSFTTSLDTSIAEHDEDLVV